MDTRARTNPFPGLRPFMQDEADLFFGRDRQSDELVQRLANRHFLAVVGTSGSGKSSLVRAGLLPSLEGGFLAEAGAHWRIAILRPQDDPIGFLARAIVETGVLAHLDLAPPAAEGVVETTLRRSGLGLVEAVRLARLDPHENLLIVVDQFEELFRFADVARQRSAGDEAPAFVKLLLEATRQTAVSVYVVITMRSDFLGDCARFRDLPEAISYCQYLIPRLTRDELQAVITGPIGVRGGRIAPSLVQRLLNDIGDDMDQLPVLQHALMRAWDHWERSNPNGRPIELSDLEASGGMAEALSQHADEAYRSLASDRDRRIAERLFKCLTERGPNNREIRRPQTVRELCAVTGADEPTVITIVDIFRRPGRSFLMPPAEVPLTSDSMIDISHESLIRNWQKLTSWVEEEAQSATIYKRLAERAELAKQGSEELLRDPALQLALDWQEKNQPSEDWARRYHPGFATSIAFLQQSQKVQKDEAEAQEKHRRDELRAARSKIVTFASLFLLALVFAAYGYIQRNEAVRLKEAAQASETGLREAKRLSDEMQRALNEAAESRAQEQQEEKEKQRAQEAKVKEAEETARRVAEETAHRAAEEARRTAEAANRTAAEALRKKDEELAATKAALAEVKRQLTQQASSEEVKKKLQEATAKLDAAQKAAQDAQKRADQDRQIAEQKQAAARQVETAVISSKEIVTISEKETTDWLTEYKQAWETKNIDKLVQVGEIRRQDAEQVQAIFARYQSFSIKLEDLKIVRAGNQATISFNRVDVVNGTEFPQPGRQVLIIEKRSDNTVVRIN